MRQPVDDAERFDELEDVMLADAATPEGDRDDGESDPPAADDEYVPV